MKKTIVVLIGSAAMAVGALAGGGGGTTACSYGFNIRDSKGVLHPVTCNGASDAFATAPVKTHKQGTTQCDTTSVVVDGVTVNVNCGLVSVSAPE